MLLYTDGAYEEEVATAGVVLCDPSKNLLEGFGLRIPDALADKWRARGSKQLVGQAELLPLVMALDRWPEQLKGARVIIFVDNDAARHAAIKGDSPSPFSAALVAAFWDRVSALEIEPWIARVASPANVADGPSRLAWGELRALGGQVVPPLSLPLDEELRRPRS